MNTVPELWDVAVVVVVGATDVGATVVVEFGDCAEIRPTNRVTTRKSRAGALVAAMTTMIFDSPFQNLSSQLKTLGRCSQNFLRSS